MYTLVFSFIRVQVGCINAVTFSKAFEEWRFCVSSIVTVSPAHAFHSSTLLVLMATENYTDIPKFPGMWCSNHSTASNFGPWCHSMIQLSIPYSIQWFPTSVLCGWIYCQQWGCGCTSEPHRLWDWGYFLRMLTYVVLCTTTHFTCLYRCLVDQGYVGQPGGRRQRLHQRPGLANLDEGGLEVASCRHVIAQKAMFRGEM